MSSDIIKNSAITEEVFVRAMDTKYADSQTAENARWYIGKYLRDRGLTSSDEAIDAIISYGNKLEQKIINQKLNDKED